MGIFDSDAWQATKHVVKSAVKGAAKWGMILGVAGVAVAALSFLTPVGYIATLSSAVFGTTGIFTSMGMAGLSAGAIGGAVLGALKGIGSADEAIDAAQEQRVLNETRAIQRAQSNALFAAQLQKQMDGGGMMVNPNMLPGGNKGQGIGRG